MKYKQKERIKLALAGCLLVFALSALGIGGQRMALMTSTGQKESCDDRPCNPDRDQKAANNPMSTQSYHVTATNEGQQPDPNKSSDSIWVILQGAAAPIGAVVAVLLWLNGLHQADIADRQRKLMKGQLKVAATAAEAAERAADAALAALDRPWIFIENLGTNREAWKLGFGELRAHFVITNYGKVPAAITSIRATLFLSFGDGNRTAPFEGEGLSDRFVPTPSADKISSLLSERGVTPCERLVIHAQDGSPAADGWSYRPLDLSAPKVLTSGQSTDALWIVEKASGEDRSGDQTTANIADCYLLGAVEYYGPARSFEKLSFLYRATNLGSFEMRGAGPYNELTRKEPDSTLV